MRCVLLAVVLAPLLACGDPARTTPDAADVPTGADAANDAGTGGVDAVPDAAPDAGVDVAADPCAEACAAVQACSPPADSPSCAGVCAADGGLAHVQGCLAGSADCPALLGCVGAGAPPPVVHPFDPDGPYGTGIRDLAGDFTVATTKGPRTLSKLWTGKDSFVVLLHARQPDGKPFAYPDALWGTNAADMLKNAAKDVHFFFASYNDPDQVVAMEAKVAKALAGLPAALRDHWTPRVHFVTEPVPAPGSGSTALGWLGQWGQANGKFLFAIDPFQRVRDFGLLYLFPVEAQGVYLKSVGIETQLYAFERARQDALRQDGVVQVPFAVAQEVPSGLDASIELPPAAQMADFDTLEVDLTTNCKQHKTELCGEWDYLAYLHLCERPKAPNGLADQACQPGIKEIAAVAEVLGACELPADATPASCKAAGDCPNSAPCKGYVAPVSGQEGVPADQQPCTCERPEGADVERVQVCRPDGKGYGACNCPCDLEMARWITSYSREGRWVTDISGRLPWLRKGGKWPVRWSAPGQPKKCDPQDKSKCWPTPYVLSGHLRLFTQGAKPVPFASEVAFQGGAGWNQNYNAQFPAKTFTPPPGTQKVELHALVTGHGFGQDEANCAEFCNHEHHFSLNGKPAQVKAHPEAGSSLGCLQQVPQGVVPNQFGTWPLGRGGWCPGLDVKPWVIDLTADLVPGQNSLSYQGLFQGKPYTPVAKPSGSGFGGSIDLEAWLVYSK